MSQSERRILIRRARHLKTFSTIGEAVADFVENRPHTADTPIGLRGKTLLRIEDAPPSLVFYCDSGEIIRLSNAGDQLAWQLVSRCSVPDRLGTETPEAEVIAFASEDADDKPPTYEWNRRKLLDSLIGFRIELVHSEPELVWFGTDAGSGLMISPCVDVRTSEEQLVWWEED